MILRELRRRFTSDTTVVDERARAQPERTAQEQARKARAASSMSALPAAMTPQVRGLPLPAEEITEHTFAKINGGPKKVSVIYNYFQKESTIFKSLESLAAQNWRACGPDDVEVIVVDDGSVNEDVAARLPPHVSYVWQRKNGYGICRAKNTGARLARGEILVFLDPDILVAPGYIDAVIETLHRFGSRTVLTGYVQDYHFVGCPDPRVEFGVWERPGRLTHRFYQLAGGNMAMTRALFAETLGFDEDLIYGGVEYLLFGYHVGKLPDTGIVFLPEMEGRHIPHPPSPAHANPQATWDVVKRKWPEFHEDYVVKGQR